MQMTLEEVYQHIPVRLTPEMERYATEEALRWSRYIFTRPISGRKQMGYCTYCKQEFETKGLRHGSKAICPICQSECHVKSVGRGRGYLYDEVYFTYWLKSAIDPDVVVAVGTHAVRDYSGDYWETETQYVDVALYVFRVGEGGVLYRRSSWYSSGKELRASGYEQMRTVRCQFRRDHNSHIHCTYSRESVAEAVNGTPFQYSTWKAYDHADMTEFVDLYARYPSVEYITKLGFSILIDYKLEGRPTLGAINWRGRTPLKTLKLTKMELTEIRSNELPIEFEELKLLQIARKDGSNFTPTEVVEISRKYYVIELIELSKHAKLRRIIRYAERQCRGMHPYESGRSAIGAWKDYIKDCIALQMDLSSERVLFPRDLYMAHQDTIERRIAEAEAIRARMREEEIVQTLAREKELDKKIRENLGKLARYEFRHSDLFIRPVESLEELLREGQALSHCVGGYRTQYASGQTVILVLRRDSAPEEPFYTVEIFRGRVTQCYGKKNSRATEEVQSFMTKFTAAKLGQGAKPDRQEVAV